MERRVRGNSHARCGAGEKLEITSNAYLSLYDVFNGAAFISMDDEDYGAWLNEQSYADTIAAAKKVVEYCKTHKELICRDRDFIPAELRTLVEELEKTMQE